MTEGTRPTLLHQQQLNRYTLLLQEVMIVVGLALVGFLFWAVLGDESLWERISNAMVFALIFICFLGATRLPGETAMIDVEDKSAFVSRLNTATSKIGYSSAAQTEDFFIYQVSSWFKGPLFGWPISVHVHEEQAMIVGPKSYVRGLLKKLAEA